jgi:hypothetical protein
MESLSHAFARSGFHVIDARHVFGGQYLWLEATAVRAEEPASFSTQSDEQLENSTAVAARASNYGRSVQRLVNRWRAMVEQLAADGGTCIWGAGAKGVTFANLVDPGGTLIDCVVDLNQSKQGGFLPGTGHRIISPERIASRTVGTAIVLNPNYAAEIRCMLESIAPNVRLVNLSKSTESLLRTTSV